METSSLNWTQIIVTAAITTLLSVLGSIAFFHYSDRSPDLVYEEFPPAFFTKGDIEVSIYTANLENIGDKEADDVQVVFEISQNALVQEVKVEPSSPAIRTNTKQSAEFIEIVAPRLNPGELIRFSILFEKGGAGVSRMFVRGKGVTGRTGPRERDSAFSSLFAFVAAVIGAAIGILLSFLSRSSVELGFNKLFSTQRKVVDQELRFARTRGNDEIDLTNLLLNTRYRLFYNPAIPGNAKSKEMVFGRNGEILTGSNRNENMWRFVGDLLELVDSDGLVHSRFYYSENNHSFYHTNDPDTGSIRKHNIRDQYMIPESPAGT